VSDYDNTLKGALFINEDKRSQNHPDYKGSIETEDGTEYWASGWIKEIKNGKKAGQKFISIALTAKDNNTSTRQSTNRQTDSGAADFLSANRDKIDQHRPRTAPAPSPDRDIDSFDDDIPF